MYNGLLTEFCEKYAKPEDIGAAAEEKSSDEELSDEEDWVQRQGSAGPSQPLGALRIVSGSNNHR